MKPDLTETLLRLSEAERLLLVDLFHCRFARAHDLSALEDISGGDAQVLLRGGFLRVADLAQGAIYWLTRRGERAACAAGNLEPAAGRAYAALRLPHELARAELYIALRRRGLPAESYAAEPRLRFRSAAGLGERTLVPDAQVERSDGRGALIEIDRGTEGARQLLHKWLRYREWLLDQRRPEGVYALTLGAPSPVLEAARQAGLPLTARPEAGQLADVILETDRGGGRNG